MQSEELVLYVYPGEWNLPSLDPECLVAMCYLKLSKLNHRVVQVTNSWQLYQNEYPRLEFKNQVFIGLESILSCIKKERNEDKQLNDTNYADMFAKLNFFKKKFLPAFTYLCWFDEDNTYRVVRRAYGQYIIFPLNMVKLKNLASRHDDLIMLNKYKSELMQQPEAMKQQFLNDAIECLNLLAAQLSDNTFMFENRPTLLDSYLFGYLSVLLQAPFNNSALKSHLQACPNLTSLINRIQRELFPLDKKALEAKQNSEGNFLTRFIQKILAMNKSGGAKSGRTSAEVAEQEKRIKQAMAVSVAAVAMLTYAIIIGLIKIDITKTDIEYIEKSVK